MGAVWKGEMKGGDGNEYGCLLKRNGSSRIFMFIDGSGVCIGMSVECVCVGLCVCVCVCVCV